MSVEEDGVIPSPVDSDYECVPAPAAGVTPPPGGADSATGPRLCPDGYVPRRKRREYELDGKEVRTHRPAERNPEADKNDAPHER